MGSHNVLISFADGSYLELIAFYRDALDHRWWEPLQKGEPLIDWTRTYGPSPYAATLRSRNSDRKILDSGLLHGAKINFAGAK